MTRELLLVALTAAPLTACDLLAPDFRLSGTVEIAADMAARAPKTNSVLFVIAKNSGGVPVAVHRIVNPEFPASFDMGPQDLLVPAIRRKEDLTLEAQMNTHGNLGDLRAGDLEGRGVAPARPGDRGARVVLDRQR